MKKFILPTLLGLLTLTACDETNIDLFDSPLEEAGTGTLTNTASKISSLEFSWQPVSGVIQYGYSLTDMDDKALRQGITRSTSVKLENLEPDTEYKLIVDAFGTNGATTKRFTLTAKTDAIVQLSAPDVDDATVEVIDGKVTITWPPVEGAETYDYVLCTADGDEIMDGTLSTNHITFNSMSAGDYMIELTADSSDDAFTRSETSVFYFTRERQITQTFSGTYTSYLLGSYPCKMNVYEDGAYSIEAFYGADGYNLEFSLSRTGVITILNNYDADGKFKYVDTGLDGDDAVLTIYEDPAYCTYSVQPTGKRIKLYVYLGGNDGGYDTFVWK